MAVDTWPASLPRNFIGDSYRETEGVNNLLQTETPAPKSRPLSSLPFRQVSGTMLLTRAQLATLRSFGRVTLLQWSLPFWFPARTGESDPEKPGYWLTRFREDGIPELGLITPAQIEISIGLYILP